MRRKIEYRITIGRKIVEGEEFRTVEIDDGHASVSLRCDTKEAVMEFLENRLELKL